MNNITTNELGDKLHDKLDELINKYSKNEYIMNRLSNYMENTLHSLLENADKNNVERAKRKEELTNNSDDFTNKFLLVNSYYYCTHNELFMYYDKIHFIADSEDNIIHKIITDINKNPELLQWKHKIKLNIIKRTKERSPLQTIPESKTIQFVLNLLQPIFNSRNHIKYFLTVIGDLLHSKSKNYFICSLPLKDILNELNIQINTYIGSINIFNNIKYKIYEHTLENCRLLYIDDSMNKIKIPNNFSKYIVDIICVASHYSSRYKNSDTFLDKCNQQNLIDHSYYLNNNSSENIVDNFISKYITECQSSIINNKNMIFIWKKFLKENKLPNILFHDSLMKILKTKLTYEDDCFKNVTSMILPVVVDFKQFWDTNICEDVGNNYDLDEISGLFKTINKKYSGVEDGFFLELIHYLYPNIAVDENKYILNIKCVIWDKKQEVNDYIILFNTDQITNIKKKINDNNNNVKSLTNIYEYYLNNNKNTLIISKNYFEKFAKDILNEYIDQDGIIDKTWFV